MSLGGEFILSCRYNVGLGALFARELCALGKDWMWSRELCHGLSLVPWSGAAIIDLPGGSAITRVGDMYYYVVRSLICLAVLLIMSVYVC
jgi:hypothetical protein